MFANVFTIILFDTRDKLKICVFLINYIEYVIQTLQ